jgi:hypothetical protein
MKPNKLYIAYDVNDSATLAIIRIIDVSMLSLAAHHTQRRHLIKFSYVIYPTKPMMVFPPTNGITKTTDLLCLYDGDFLKKSVSSWSHLRNEMTTIRFREL